ncbi:hypothetical protein VB712_09465 [Spirulina sp. CCNP1310]|uniref:hypothetical protein n=1 Tax=Spirulina sp. CCNP1310 TaxID=3110249 RepID=UPI002B1FDD52|nr:hypothetical protein [Spirulina sp. CCNP1310]MEA5419453.1 hypothetical protein [Spirulina sp. CCNP1310]
MAHIQHLASQSALLPRLPLRLMVQFKPREIQANRDYGIHAALYPMPLSGHLARRYCSLLVHLSPPPDQALTWGRWFPCDWVRPDGRSWVGVCLDRLPFPITPTPNPRTIPVHLLLTVADISPVFQGMMAASA